MVVGGGPAGLTAALTLGSLRPDLKPRIVVLEAERYPREKYCAGAVGGRGEKILEALDALPDVPSAPIDGMSLRADGAEVSTRIGRIGRVVRRIEYDHALAKKVARRGLKVQDGTPVSAVRVEGAGAVVETPAGELRAAVVIGADGVGSVVRRAMGLPRGKLRAQVLELDTEPVAGDRDRDLIHFDAGDRRLPGYTWDFPTVVGGKELVCRGIYHLRMADEQVDLTGLFGERLAAMGLDIRAYKNKRFAERGYEPGSPIVKGPLMLCGEAAGIDPITGEGIAQAIEYGHLAGTFLAASVGSAPSIDGWTRFVQTSRLARDLSVRTRAVTAFYGAARPRMERFLARTPSALHLGCQHFGALPYDRLRLVDLAARGGVALLASLLGA